jgi:hypothetical protein
MTCACGSNVCYICRKVSDFLLVADDVTNKRVNVQDISKEKYHHFCQTPHCKHDRCGIIIHSPVSVIRIVQMMNRKVCALFGHCGRRQKGYA